MRTRTAAVCAVTFFAMTSGAFGSDAPPIDPATIPLDKYVTVSPDGHLQCEGKRVRYWGWIGHFLLEPPLNRYKLAATDTPEERSRKIQKTYAVYDALAQRIHDLGFNLVRIWSVGDWVSDYTPGDGSDADCFAYSMNALEKRGIKLWMTRLGNLGYAAPEEADVINDPATHSAWKQAVTSEKIQISHGLAYGWDPRLRAIAVKHARNIMDFRNKYKGGLRLGDDPQVAVWELTNEEWWFTHMINGGWGELQKQPKFFRDELQGRWCAWLKARYTSDAGLTKAWRSLLPGESLTKKSVLLAPLASGNSPKIQNDANPAVFAAMTPGKVEYTARDFSTQRGEDVIAFLVGLHIEFKSAIRDGLRAQGRGIARVPIIFDTGENYRIQQLLVNESNDASVMDTYIWQFAKDRQQPRFPWESGLDAYPRTAMGPEAWAETARMPGKPFFMYETQTNNPSKYRAEFPYRIAALAAIQDMDIVCWHLFGRPGDPDLERPYDRPLALSTRDLGVEGVHYKNDEVESSAMKLAGTMFVTGALKPPPKPTLMIFGRHSVYDPASLSYGRSFGEYRSLINPTVYRYGLYMKVDTTRETDTIIGPTVWPGINEACPVRPTNQISFDWHKGNLVFDAPAAVSYTGFYANNGGPVRFQNGIVLDEVEVRNPEGMPYPVTDKEKYIAFGMVARDGASLDKSKDVVLSLVSTSFNAGFSLNEDNVADQRPYDGMVSGGNVKGKPPVLVARVGAKITAAPLNGMKYALKDWHFKTLGEGVVRDGVLRIPADKAVFYVELTR